MKKKEIRRGFELYRKLSKKQRKQFKANCSDFQYEINRTTVFGYFISGAFTWFDTPQGRDYWRQISEKKL